MTKHIKPIKSETRLGKHVRCWINNQVETGYTHRDALDDLSHGGCQSGMVNHLIYYTDTAKFYKKYKKEIAELLVESLEATGLGVDELFGDNWDDTDPLADDTQNQNLLSWFGFEETAHNIGLYIDS